MEDTIENFTEINIKLEPGLTDDDDPNSQEAFSEQSNESRLKHVKVEPQDLHNVTVKGEDIITEGGKEFIKVEVKCEQFTEDTQNSITIVYEPILPPTLKDSLEPEPKIELTKVHTPQQNYTQEKLTEVTAKFICDICNKGFKERSSFKVHIKQHVNENLYHCRVCAKSFTHQNSLKEHMNSHIDQKPFKCKFCDKGFTRNTTARAHERLHDGQLFTCDLCHKRFSAKSSIYRHKCLTAKEKIFKCDKCPKAYVCKESLTSHAYIHTGIEPFVCKFCNVGFAIRKKLQLHVCKNKVSQNVKPVFVKVLTVNQDQPEDESNLKLNVKKERDPADIQGVYCCDKCSRRFYDQQKLNEHTFRHLFKYYTCDICSKKFTSKNGLIYHIGAHSGLKRYDCNQCKKSFVHQLGLQAHLKWHTSVKIPCTVCNKEFSAKSSLLVHSRIHTGETPFDCTFCDKSFRDGSTLIRHKRKHLGQKPYSCELCPKSFISKLNLRAHLTIHTGVKPYNCEFCQKGYAVKFKWQKHLDTCKARTKIAKECENLEDSTEVETSYKNSTEKLVDSAKSKRKRKVKDPSKQTNDVDSPKKRNRSKKGNGNNLTERKGNDNPTKIIEKATCAKDLKETNKGKATLTKSKDWTKTNSTNEPIEIVSKDNLVKAEIAIVVSNTTTPLFFNSVESILSNRNDSTETKDISNSTERAETNGSKELETRIYVVKQENEDSSEYII